MLKRRLAPALCCAALLLASAPSAALAQAQRGAAAERPLSAPAPEKRPELRALFAESVARARAVGVPAEADFKRFEELRRQEEAQPPEEEEKWSTRKKVLIIVAIIGSVALVAWATANSVDNPPPFCDTDRSDPNCIL